MPLSQGSASSPYVGMTLKAWAYISAAGALLRGFNVTSSSRGSVGVYTVTFTSAMSSTAYLVDSLNRGFNRSPMSGIKTTGSYANYELRSDAATAADQDHYICFYE